MKNIILAVLMASVSLGAMTTTASAWGSARCKFSEGAVKPYTYFKHCHDYIDNDERVYYRASKWWRWKYSDIWQINDGVITKSEARKAREHREINGKKESKYGEPYDRFNRQHRGFGDYANGGKRTDISLNNGIRF